MLKIINRLMGQSKTRSHLLTAIVKEKKHVEFSQKFIREKSIKRNNFELSFIYNEGAIIIAP